MPSVATQPTYPMRDSNERMDRSSAELLTRKLLSEKMVCFALEIMWLALHCKSSSEIDTLWLGAFCVLNCTCVQFLRSRLFAECSSRMSLNYAYGRTCAQRSELQGELHARGLSYRVSYDDFVCRISIRSCAYVRRVGPLRTFHSWFRACFPFFCRRN